MPEKKKKVKKPWRNLHGPRVSGSCLTRSRAALWEIPKKKELEGGGNICAREETAKYGGTRPEKFLAKFISGVPQKPLSEGGGKKVHASKFRKAAL